jgi:hypothetical protein
MCVDELTAIDLEGDRRRCYVPGFRTSTTSFDQRKERSVTNFQFVRLALGASILCLSAAWTSLAAAEAAPAPGAYPPAATPPPGAAGYAPPAAYPAPPPGYAYATPSYSAYPTRLRPPDSVPYDGGPVPAGYHLEKRPRRGLLIAGPIILGVPYVLGLAVASGGNFPNSTGWLVVPGIGPWLTLALRHKSSSTCSDSSSRGDCAVDTTLDDATRTFLVIDGFMQTAGAVMIIGGIASPREVIARDFVGSLHFAPSPMGRAGYGGVVTGAF